MTEVSIDAGKIRRCRYCFIEGDRTTLRYERGLYSDAQYECRDATECGARIRASKSTDLTVQEPSQK